MTFYFQFVGDHVNLHFKLVQAYIMAGDLDKAQQVFEFTYLLYTRVVQLFVGWSACQMGKGAREELIFVFVFWHN